ncbi:hypothetical protein NA56DRAFT_72566 [Hyaloscypha hepaticicola]|uniref:Uncharacterized protein n=1 Tax=Hyaloscypha hepaticicola TaxID=2082293 RepID=A0A2J6QB71_9HELO|nr:hypothetical protein NA56DRAFT_72566 [Hyaloscypha hepaticicola]
MSSSEHKRPIDPTYGTVEHNGNIEDNDNIEHQAPITNSQPRRKYKGFPRSICFFFITSTLCITALVSLSLKFLGNGANILSPPFTTPPQDWSGFKNQSWAVGIDFSAGQKSTVLRSE